MNHACAVVIGADPATILGAVTSSRYIVRISICWLLRNKSTELVNVNNDIKVPANAIV